MASKKLTFHYLSEQEIIKTGLTLSECIELCTCAFKEHGEKQIENPPKIAIHPLPDAFLHAMPGRYRIIRYYIACKLLASVRGYLMVEINISLYNLQ